MIDGAPDAIADLGERAGEPDRLAARIGQIDGDDLGEASGTGGHHDHAVGEIDGLVDVVGDEHHRPSLAIPRIEQLILHLNAGQRVERAERLVHQQNGRVDRIGAGDGATLLHAAGEHLGQGVGEVGKTDEIDEALRGRAPLGRATAGDPQAELHVLSDGEPGKERVLLKDHAALGTGSAHIAAVDDHFACGRRDQAGGDGERRRFAATRRPDQGDELAIRHVDRQAVEREKARALVSKPTRHGAERDLGAHMRSCQCVSRVSSARSRRSIARPRIPMVIRLTKMVARS